MREASKLSNKPHAVAQLFSGSHPSQGDLLEMIDTSSNSNLNFDNNFSEPIFPFQPPSQSKKKLVDFTQTPSDDMKPVTVSQMMQEVKQEQVYPFYEQLSDEPPIPEII